MTVDENAIIEASPDVVACELDGGAALLDMRSSVYYGMNPVGAHIWTAIQARPTAVREIFAAVEATFAVSGDQYQRDVIALLGQLSEANLVTVRHAPA
jgi:hypothetical protein